MSLPGLHEQGGFRLGRRSRSAAGRRDGRCPGSRVLVAWRVSPELGVEVFLGVRADLRGRLGVSGARDRAESRVRGTA